ncbi:hypothetical protein SAMN05216243_1767 [Sediminibacillus albus]|uniref:Uncharacterized protein n=1 Tax=Sediminibacillus albus TaxID=407036 RepID=A0A1G8YQF7_9BACI|nr:hypothetical protein SAMN05216243_1767 [Sediminibacillus albus]
MLDRQNQKLFGQPKTEEHIDQLTFQNSDTFKKKAKKR